MDIRNLIEQTGNNIFGVTFRKADGSIRNMQARIHVSNPKQAVKPKGIEDRKANDIATNTMTVFDMNKRERGVRGAWRRFSLGSVMQLRIKGKVYNT